MIYLVLNLDVFHTFRESYIGTRANVSQWFAFCPSLRVFASHGNVKTNWFSQIYWSQPSDQFGGKKQFVYVQIIVHFLAPEHFLFHSCRQLFVVSQFLTVRSHDVDPTDGHDKRTTMQHIFVLNCAETNHCSDNRLA